MEQIHIQREFMKSNFASLLASYASDQSRGVPEPPLEVACNETAETIVLPPPSPDTVVKGSVMACIDERRSCRSWSKAPLTLAELSFLLWATQGVREVLGDGYATLRTVPSGGARHPFETYLVLSSVDGVLPGVYRYLPLSHRLVFLFGDVEMQNKLFHAVFGQRFVSDAPATFVWSCVPYRGEWRYTVAAHKTMLLDAGHVCQNLYLACEAIGAGTCAIAAYDQQALDALLQLDGEDEFSVYLAPVGKPRVRS